MGRMGAEGFAELVEEGQATLEASLVWHLQANHYPPVPTAFLPVALEAIERAQDEDWDHVITMPNDVTLSVGEIVDGLHLESFVGLI